MEFGVMDTSPARAAQQFLQEWRGGGLTCLKCSRSITGSLVRRNADVYHAACAPADRPIRAPVAPSTAIIGMIGGVAASFNVINTIRAKNGAQDHDKLEGGCFSRSIDRGLTELRVNHAATVAGKFEHLAADGGRLAWGFQVFDTPLGQQVMRDVRAGTIRGCSVGFTKLQCRWDDYVEIVEDADLIEISILRGSTPALWDTCPSRIPNSLAEYRAKASLRAADRVPYAVALWKLSCSPCCTWPSRPQSSVGPAACEP